MSDDRTVKVSLDAELGGLTTGLRSAAGEAASLAVAIKQVGQSASGLDRIGRSARQLNGAGMSRAARDARGVADATGRIGKTASGIDRTAAATRRLGQAVPSSSKLAAFSKQLDRIDQKSASLNKVGNAMFKIGATAGASLVASAKAAMDWESAWTGVTKTVDGSQQQLAQLEGQLRDMAKSMPESHEQIAAVAEAAGQLGVRTQDIAKFTKVMVELGDTTNLTSDEAATSLAQFMNIMGTAGRDVERLGSTVVDLGNNGASTERQIVEMGLRIAGAGKQIGLSEQDVLAYANALASVGIEAEAGGTAISTVFLKLDQIVRQGGDKLESLANVAGVTANQFVKDWGSDAAGALDAVLHGLNQVQQSGGNVTAILDDLGLKGIRVSDAVRRLASSGDLLSDSLNLSANAWDKNTALAIEAGKRYATTESRVKVAWNNIKDAAIDAGGSILPVLAEFADGAGKLIDQWDKLSDQTKTSIVKIVAAVAGIALAGAGITKAVTAVAALKTALVELGIVSEVTGAKVAASGEAAMAGAGKMRKAAGGVVAALIGMQVAGQVADKIIGDYRVTTEDATTALLNMAKGGKGAQQSLNAIFSKPKGSGDFWGAEQINNLDEAINRVFNRSTSDKVNDAITGWVSNFGLAKGQLDQLKEQFSDLDSALVDMSSKGHADQAAAAFSKITDSARRNHVSMEQLLTLFPEYKAQLQAQANQLGVTNLTAKDYADWMGGKIPKAISKASTAITRNKDATKEQKEAAALIPGAYQQWASASDELAKKEDALQKATDKLISQITVLRTGAIDAEQANEHWEEAVDNLTRSVKDNGKSLDIHTGKGRANRAAILDAIQAMNDQITAQFKNEVQTKGLSKATEDASKRLRQQKTDLVETAKKAGYNRSEVKKMVDQMVLTPKELRTQVKAYGIDELREQVKRLQKQIDDLTGKHDVGLDYHISIDGTKVNFSKMSGPGFGSRGGYSRPFATGGFVSGSGGGTEDKIPARLSNGEYVIKASSVDKIGRHRLDYMNWTGEVPAFRDGGLVNTGGLNTGANGALGPAAVTPITVDGTIAAGAVKAVVDAVVATSRSVQDAVGNYVKGALSGGGVRMGGNNIVSWHGGRFTENFAKHLQLVYSQQPFQVYQGGFRPTTSYSGSTHNKDAIDAGPNYDRLALLMRQVGIAAWHRTPAQGPWVHHTHGVPGPNVGLASPSAARQYQDWLNGGNGLGGKDDGPHVAMMGLAGMAAAGGGSSRQIAKRFMIARYGAAMWPYIDYIGMHESGWNPHARNPQSGAYGVGQALPPSKMAAYGPDWRNNELTQLRWMAAYMDSRYGGPLGAYQFWRTHHWYSSGGHVSGPGTDTSDDIPAWLSNGEFVVNARATRKHRDLLELINADRFATGGVVGYGSSSKFDIAAIVKLITAINNPIRALEQFTLAVKKATKANAAAQRELRAPRARLDRATRAYNRARDERDRLRLQNARQTNAARDRVARATEQVKAARLALDKMEPKSEKIRKAQSALVSAENSLAAKRRSAAESIAKIEDRIRKTKKGTTAYQNLLLEKELKQKANARAISAAEDKVAKARKAAQKAGVNTDKIVSAQKRLAKAEAALDRARAHQSKVSRQNTLEMAEANAKVTKAEKEKRKATEAYNRVADKAKEKAQKLKDAQQQLAEQQRAVADAARQVSDAFTDTYLSKSTTLNDWLQSMTLGAKDITGLQSRIAKLRKLGLNETLVQQIISMAQSTGAPAGQQIADQIIAGGSKTIDNLNKATKGLQDAADKLGYAVATGKGRYATGGLVHGPGTGTSDSITARLSAGEYVVNARATARNLPLLNQINYGSRTPTVNRAVPAYATGGYVGGDGISKAELIDAVATLIDSRPMFQGNRFGSDPEEIVRSLNAGRRRNLHRAGIGVRRS